MITAARGAQLAALSLHPVKRRLPDYSTRPRLLRRPQAGRSSRTSAHVVMAGLGLGGYANWALAMLTSVPIWGRRRRSDAVATRSQVRHPLKASFPHRCSCACCTGCIRVVNRATDGSRGPRGCRGSSEEPDRLCAAVCSPLGFFHVKDRSAMTFPDPFPGLEHEIAEVNGVKCVLTSIPPSPV